LVACILLDTCYNCYAMFPDIHMLLSISLSHAPSLLQLCFSSPYYFSLVLHLSLTLLLFLSLVLLHSLCLAITKLKEARRFLHCKWKSNPFEDFCLHQFVVYVMKSMKKWKRFVFWFWGFWKIDSWLNGFYVSKFTLFLPLLFTIFTIELGINKKNLIFCCCVLLLMSWSKCMHCG
jgi:hypothetical protein